MPLLAGRLCSCAGRLIAVHRRFARERGLAESPRPWPGQGRWGMRGDGLRGRERESERIKGSERAREPQCCIVAGESCLVLSVRVSHALMCVDDCSAFRWGKTGLQIRQLQIFAVTTVCGSATVLTVAKSSRQRKVRCVHNTHWWVSPPNKMRCRPMPARQQQSQGRGWAGGPGLVLLALPLQCNSCGKSCLQCSKFRPKINGQAPFDGGALSDVVTCWRLGHADCRDIPAKGWTGKEQSGSG